MFDRPALGLDLEATLARILADDVQLAAEHLGVPVNQAAGEALVRPDLPNLRMVESSPQKRPLHAIPILDTGRDDMDRDEQAEGVGDQRALAALDLLARVEAPGGRRDGVGSADRLRVDQSCARLCLSAVGLTDPAAQDVVDVFDGAVVVGPGEVPVHSRPGREVLRQLPPGAPGPHHVEDRVHDPPTWVLLPTSAPRAYPRGGSNGSTNTHWSSVRSGG
ncbi:hypothetical protein GCM10022207_92140 [Streptomyces lannensis]|uniref:Uncharacterized protein n=1 Tax=Streptomyces lannensis TaxID=766498 RepID=A0ABP7LVC6_9ACTN